MGYNISDRISRGNALFVCESLGVLEGEVSSSLFGIALVSCWYWYWYWFGYVGIVSGTGTRNGAHTCGVVLALVRLLARVADFNESDEYSPLPYQRGYEAWGGLASRSFIPVQGQGEATAEGRSKATIGPLRPRLTSAITILP